MNEFAILFKKDITCVWRAKQLMLGTFGFALLLVVVASFAFRQVGYGQEELRAITPGILWLVFLFAGLIGLNQTFLFEQQNSALQGVLLSKVQPNVVYFAKLSSNFLFLSLVQILVLLAHGVLFGAEIFFVFPQLLFVTVLVALGFTALGTLLSAMAVATTSREIVLPLLLFPLSIPLVAGAVFLTRELLQSGSFPFASFWFTLVVVFDVISLVLAWLLFEFVVKE